MSDTFANKPFKNFFSGKQIYNYLIQFMAVFSGIQVSVGKNDYTTEQSTIYVPIRYGSTSRTVEWIVAGQTQNKPPRVPIMSAKVTSMELAPELRKGIGQEIARSHLPRGGVLPDDIKVISQRTPNPCKMGIELSILTSNIKNRFEIMEQILILFDPDIQLFLSDNFMDTNKISRLELMSISLEDEYPMGQNNSIMVDTYAFTANINIRSPVDLKESYVKSVILRLDAISDLPVEDAVIELNNSSNRGTILFDINNMDIPEN